MTTDGMPSTRYEKTACSFMGVLCLAAAMDWIKRWQSLKWLVSFGPLEAISDHLTGQLG